MGNQVARFRVAETLICHSMAMPETGARNRTRTGTGRLAIVAARHSLMVGLGFVRLDGDAAMTWPPNLQQEAIIDRHLDADLRKYHADGSQNLVNIGQET